MLYIFGYGSLMWKQGFDYEEKLYGHIKGFKRRFWAGSVVFRGVPGKPGRVISVSPSDNLEEKVWGIAFRIHPDNEEAVRQKLKAREIGYDKVITTFYQMMPAGLEPITLEVLMYKESEGASTFQGPADEKQIALQIYSVRGKGGPNIEYLMKMIWYHKNFFSHEPDQHLDLLEHEIRAIARDEGTELEPYSLL